MASLTLRPLRARASSQRGAEIIEFAIVAPLLALLIAALFDFGFLFRNWEVMTNAVREGARVGVLPSYSCDGADSDVESRIDAYLTGSGIPNNYVVDLRTDTITSGGRSFSACLVNITFDQTLPTLQVLGGIFGGAFGTVQLSATAVMRAEAQSAPAP